MKAVLALMTMAQAARARDDLETLGRLMARIFLEVHPDDLRLVLRTMTEAWLKATAQAAGPAGIVAASELCQQAIAAAVDQRLVEASQHFIEARAAYREHPRVNPTAEMLALGAMQASKQVIDERVRDAKLKELVDRGSALMVQPGRKGEALSIFREALALLPDPPRQEADRVRAARLRRLIAEQEQVGEASPDDPAAFLPPPNSMPHDAWDELGMRLMAKNPEHARICFERAIAAEPTVGTYWLHLASTLLAVGAPADASIEAFQKATSRSPREIRAWVGLAASLQEAARYREAVAAWDEAIGLAPDAEAPKQERAFCKRAADLLAQGAGWGVNEWGQGGMIFVDKGQWALADFAYGRALAIDPGHLGALCGKGMANYKWAVDLKAEGNAAAPLRFRMAAEAIREALQIQPGNDSMTTLLGLCEGELGPR